VKGKEKRIEIYSADKQPIGQFDKRKPFTNIKIDFEKKDTLYLFTDGFVDQFGGPKGKKFKRKKFKELLISINNRTSKEKKSDIDSIFESWRGEIEQVDDVCVVGIHL
jgi:serine phosphatase RsbU (regulator of sigma subunit)